MRLFLVFLIPSLQSDGQHRTVPIGPSCGDKKPERCAPACRLVGQCPHATAHVTFLVSFLSKIAVIFVLMQCLMAVFSTDNNLIQLPEFSIIRTACATR
jgi:hypothetical protein